MTDELDQREILTGELGSYWGGYYPGTSQVEALVAARSRLDQQVQDEFAELQASISRQTVPIERTRRYYPLVLQLADRGQVPLVYGSAGLYGDPIVYGQTQAGSPTWACPPGLTAAVSISDQITHPDVVLLSGIDYDIVDGRISFAIDPFEDDRFVPHIEADGSSSLVLWLRASRWQDQLVHRQFGYVFGLQHDDSPNYRDLVNAVYDGAILGSSWRSLLRLISATCDIPIAAGTETVENIFDDGRHLWIVTGTNAYRHSRSASATVAPGQRLTAGQTMTDALQAADFSRGIVPSWISSLSLDKGFIGPGYLGALAFRNADLATTVTEGEWTEIRFPVSGWPADVERFWTLVQDRGIAAGQTFAMLLDTRTSPEGQPTPASLPTIENPLKFVVANVLRENGAAVRIRADALGDRAIGLGGIATVLRSLVPPSTVLFILTSILTKDTIDRSRVTDRLTLSIGLAASRDKFGRSDITERLMVRTETAPCR